jgi:hypothetical protein
MLGMNTLRAKESVETDQWPAEIGEQMAAVHQVIYPVSADPRLVELLKLVEELREKPAH